ncbi:MAG TPA: hypothetical protein VLH59_10800 [Ignavibacteriaceae bacterium]|nr:hypothetical protein [Ignavibacteriaceae bacterium]
MQTIKDKMLIYDENAEVRFSVLKITALWAFSESAFGGILHALTIPLRGIFLSSAAVLFISLIALFSKNSKEILKATLIVILIKALVSPHSPLAAYLAVSLQGVLGFLLFSTKKFYRLSALLLGLLVLFFSGIQKIVVLTILFGNTLWESLDLFIEQVSSEIFKVNHPDINYGYVLIAAYVLLHLIAGLFIGLYAGRLPERINHYKKIIPSSIENKTGEEIPHKEKRKKRSWFLRPTGIFIIVLSAGVIILSYLSPELEENVATSVLIMLVRSLIITFVWYVVLAPVAKKIFQKFIAKRKSEYAKELEEIISMFPKFKEIVNYCWKLSGDKKGYKRIRYFLSTSFYYLLLSE